MLLTARAAPGEELLASHHAKPSSETRTGAATPYKKRVGILREKVTGGITNTRASIHDIKTVQKRLCQV